MALRTRPALRNPSKMCTMRKNFSITKSFSSKKALVKWVVQTYSRRWADELMVNEEVPSTLRGPQLASPPLRPPPPVPPTPTPPQPSSRVPPVPPPPPTHTTTQSRSSFKGKALLRKPNQPAKTRSLSGTYHFAGWYWVC